MLAISSLSLSSHWVSSSPVSKSVVNDFAIYRDVSSDFRTYDFSQLDRTEKKQKTKKTAAVIPLVEVSTPTRQARDSSIAPVDLEDVALPWKSYEKPNKWKSFTKKLRWLVAVFPFQVLILTIVFIAAALLYFSLSTAAFYEYSRVNRELLLVHVNSALTIDPRGGVRLNSPFGSKNVSLLINGTASSDKATIVQVASQAKDGEIGRAHV